MVTSTIESLKNALALSLRGVSLRDKLRLMTGFVVLGVLNKIIIAIAEALGLSVERVQKRLLIVRNRFIRGTIIHHKGLKYSLIDHHCAQLFLESFEPWMWRYLEDLKEDDVFIDVGAHVGLYSVYAANRLRRGLVISIEANPENYRFLVTNIQINSLNNVIAMNLAAYRENTRLPLYISNVSGRHSLFHPEPREKNMCGSRPRD